VRSSTIETIRRDEDLEVLIPEVQQETRRRRPRLSARALAAIIAAVALGTSLLLATGSSGRTAARHVGTGTPIERAPTGAISIGRAPTGAISIGRAPTLEVYRRFSGQYATPIYFRTVGSQSPPEALANGIWASETPSVGNSAALAVYGGGFGRNAYFGSTIYGVGNETISVRMRTPRSWSAGQGSVLLAVHNNAHIQVQSGAQTSIIEVNMRSGRVVHIYSAPGVPFTPGPGYKGLYTGHLSGGWIESLFLDAGQLYAFQYSAYSASVDDLSNGTSHLLRGYGSLGGGALDVNGSLYVMAWREAPHPTSFDLLRINPNTLAIVSTTHTGVRATTVDNFQMQALPGGGLLAFVAQQRTYQQDNPMSACLWRLSTSGLERRDLPANIGLYMHAFANGVYVFGGPGRNVVARLNFASMSLTRDVPALATPSGTYLFALT
jgi:hypothetical protein